MHSFDSELPSVVVVAAVEGAFADFALAGRVPSHSFTCVEEATVALPCLP